MARSVAGDWMTHLPLVLLGVRSSVREDSGVSPAELLYGTPLRLPGQLIDAAPVSVSPPSSDLVRHLQEIMKLSEQMPVNYHGTTQSHLPPSLTDARYVFVRIDAVKPPLTRPYEGPFCVITPGVKTFTIERLGKPWVVSVDRLKPAWGFFGLSPGVTSPPHDPSPSTKPPADGAATELEPSVANSKPLSPLLTCSGRVSRPPSRFSTN